MANLARLRLSIFGITDDETTFARRGFSATQPATQQRLEQIGRTFVRGYRLALAEPGAQRLSSHLDEIESEARGFAYEGAAMALALLDEFTPWRRRRLPALLRGTGAAHAYMLHVGAGWAAARVPWAARLIEQRIAAVDPLLGWLAIDGFGFHQGYFHPARHIAHHQVPGHLSAAGRCVFDQGLGRSLWFVEGADVARIHTTINGFAVSRQADLWSGVGLACAYAGGAEPAALQQLRRVASDHLPAIGQGVAFAAKARVRAGNPTPHTDLACQVFCGLTSATAAAITDQCLPDMPGVRQPGTGETTSVHHRPPTAFETWRGAIQRRLHDMSTSTAEVAYAHNG